MTYTRDKNYPVTGWELGEQPQLYRLLPQLKKFLALLWRRLMGERDLLVQVLGNDYTSAHAHCQKDTQGGVTVLVLNYSNTTT
ncbi:hypothetical protein Mapa_014375 [Marchantia paleacea]|nr:hypothetical protein Mapa_014375 [Marchantia paleacea]